MAINKKLIHFKTKQKFDEELAKGNILNTSIVFILDTTEIYTHGLLYDGSTFDPSDIEASILNITDNYVTTETLNLAVKAVNSNISGFSQSINNTLQNVSEKANKADATATDALNLAEGIQGNLSSFALKSDVEVGAEVENGVYIVDLNGTLHDPNTFTGTADDVTGIGLVTDKVKMIVALDEWYSYSESTAWNGNIRSAWGGYGKTVTDIKTTTSSSEAILDFDGEANTDAIIAQLQGTTDNYSQFYTGTPAAEYCRAYSKGYKGAGSWYLPAAGELNEIGLNKDAINAILTKLGKNSLSKNPYTWSSAQYGSDLAWGYYWSNSSWRDNAKYSFGGVRPICKLEKKSLKEKVAELETTANAALSTASDALSKATKALSKATKALSTASDALSKASDALSTASDALSTADSAESTADSAESKAAKALSTANKKQDKLVSGTNIKTINGESILGSGDIVIEGGSSGGGAYAEVNHGTSDTTFTLTPNTFHVWDEVASLDLSFAEENAGVANEYLFQFTSGSTATTLTLPDGLKWTNDDAPTISENMIYQISILKGLASILGFNNKPELIENLCVGELSGNNIVFTFQHPVASDLTITFLGEMTSTVTINKGETSVTYTGLMIPLFDGIRSIIPNEDNSYIYKF